MKKKQEQNSEFEDPAAEWGFVSFSFGVMIFLLTHIFTMDIPFPLQGNVRIISQIAVGIGTCLAILGIILAFIVAPIRIEQKKQEGK